MIELLPQLYTLGQPKVFPKGTHIYHAHLPVNQCYYIISGIVKVYIDHHNGKRSVLDFFNSGDWLGEISIFTHEDTIKENQVLEEVHCLEFDLDMLQKHCNSSAETSFYFAQYLANKLIARSYRMSEYMNYSLVEKLAQFIIQYEENGIYSISHTDASEYLNVSYRHVLYIIKKFCDQGILKKEKNYKITDYIQLEKYVSSHGNGQ
jgi:CRP/FNR family putative post-exponential-phase nitrogen-starvation transcriptional regulator